MQKKDKPKVIIIETERLLIRHILPDDISRLHRIYNKTENMQYVSNGKSDWTKIELLDKYTKFNKYYELGFGIYTVVIKKTGEIIGEAGLFNSFKDASKLELGYIIDSEYWLKGYGKETCLGLINYAFTELNVRTLVARMYSTNLNSIALSEVCGMIKKESGFTVNGKEYLTYEIQKKHESLTMANKA